MPLAAELCRPCRRADLGLLGPLGSLLALGDEGPHLREAPNLRAPADASLPHPAGRGSSGRASRGWGVLGLQSGARGTAATRLRTSVDGCSGRTKRDR
jgi:hypothetical protein